MNFYDKRAYEHEADKRIHALKREIKELSKHRKKAKNNLSEGIHDITISLKDSGRHMLNKLKGKSDVADYLDRNARMHPGKLAAFALGIGAILTTVKAIKHNRCHYH